jgi:quinol monooxygenase YgiN
MIGGIKKVKPIKGKEKEFEVLFNQLKAQVRLNEPGNEYYDLYQSHDEPGSYVVMERYRDQAALDAHDKSPHGALFFPKIRALLEVLEVKYFDAVEE